MNTTELKSTLHLLIDRINDDAVLQAYLVLLSRDVDTTDFWDKLDIATKVAIEEGINDLNAGRKTNFFHYMNNQHGINRLNFRPRSSRH
jgi:hypothetical protein